jgi:hypothetical protein
MIIPDAIAQQFDDMRRLLGTVIGQNNNLLEEVEQRRSYDVEIPLHNPSLRRIEDLLRRALLNLGDSDIAEQMGRPRKNDRDYDDDDDGYPFPRQPLSAKSPSTKHGSFYRGGDSLYSEELNPKVRAPPGSETSTMKRNRGGPSPIPDSLLNGSVGDPDFDEDWAMQNLVPETPPSDYIPPRAAIPPYLTDHLRGQKRATPQATPRPQPRPTPQQPYREPSPSPPPSVYTEDMHPESEQGDQPLPESDDGRDQTPVPYHQDQQPQEEGSIYTEDEYQRDPARRLPPPQPVDLPTPVGSQRNFPPYPSGPSAGPTASMRPQYPGMMRPMPPGMSEMPRPSMPRIAGVRDPISTT